MFKTMFRPLDGGSDARQGAMEVAMERVREAQWLIERSTFVEKQSVQWHQCRISISPTVDRALADVRTRAERRAEREWLLVRGPESSATDA